MRTVVRNARIVDESVAGSWPEAQHIVVDDDRITDLLPATADPPAADVEVDAGGGLAIAGMVNGHAHNNELFMKGRSWGVPLEPYILLNSPRNPRRSGLSPNDIYQRTLAACGEMLRNGITAVADDVAHPTLSREDVEAVLHGYRDAGMRARVSVVVEDAPWSRSVPFQGKVDEPLMSTPMHTRDEALAAYVGLLTDWGDPSARVSVMVSPSAPQRCTPELLDELVATARERGLPFHIHVQETLSQYMHGPELFDGVSMIRFLSDRKLLGPETTIAHGVWIDDDDIRCIADAGANVVHNPVSNLKLGSGVAPVRRLLEAGVNVALGTDGLTCNDALDMFEVTKLAAILSCIATSEDARWLSPAEALRMATLGGARANFMADVGTIAVGAQADLVTLAADAPAFVPRNDAVSQMVYSARSGDVRHVLVDGALVMRDRVSQRFDLAAVHNHVLEAAAHFWAEARPSIEENLRLHSGVDAAYRQYARDVHARPVYRIIDDSPGAERD